MYLAYTMVGFVLFSLVMSFLFFNLFSKKQESYIKFWGLFWIAYSVGLIFLILSLNYDSIVLLEMRKIFDMYNIMFLLFGAYSFVHFQIPSYWYRFSFYLTIWVMLGAYYNFDLISVYMPISLFEIIITLVLCGIIFKYWQTSLMNKILVITVFSLWGFGKALSSIGEVYFSFNSSVYMLEIIFTNVLSFCIFIIYIQRIQDNSASGEMLYHIIAENATDVIFYYSLSPKPAFTYITPSIESLTGYSPKEFYQNPKFYLNIVDSEYFNEITEIFSGKGDITDIKVLKILDKNDVPKWCEFHNKIILNDFGPVAIESFVRDITLMKEAEEHLLRSKSSRDLLLSYISHELKTPVSSILGYVKGILDGIIINEEEQKVAMEIVFSKTMTLERLINDLFLLSKLETNQFSFQFAEIATDELAKELVKRNTLDVKTAGLKLIIDADWPTIENHYVIADIERINQVFSNIIYNAVKFSHPNGEITVKIEITNDKKYLLFSISDEGIGISSKDIPFVFDRFFKSQDPLRKGKLSGSGLGLTLSKQIIEGHGGIISVESILEQGSTFIFKLPLYD